MSARDHYSLPLLCLVCGRPGTASWSENARPSIYTGTGRTLDKVSEGFKIVPPSSGEGDSVAHCVECGVQAEV